MISYSECRGVLAHNHDIYYEQEVVSVAVQNIESSKEMPSENIDVLNMSA